MEIQTPMISIECKNTKIAITYSSLEGSFQLFHPSGATISVMEVFMNTVVEYTPQALPSHTKPFPWILQFTNENPVFSANEALCCAATAPLMLGPLATEFSVQFWRKKMHRISVQTCKRCFYTSYKHLKGVFIYKCKEYKS